MEINEIIKKHCVEKIINSLKVPTNYKKDLIQEIYLILLRDRKIKNIEKERQLYNYIYGICRNQWLSKTSKFFYKYKKNQQKNISLDYDNSRVN